MSHWQKSQRRDGPKSCPPLGQVVTCGMFGVARSLCLVGWVTEKRGGSWARKETSVMSAHLCTRRSQQGVPRCLSLSPASGNRADAPRSSQGALCWVPMLTHSLNTTILLFPLAIPFTGGETEAESGSVSSPGHEPEHKG